MRANGYVALALFAAAAIPSAPAFANTCQAGRLSCPTTMPIDGYCECTAHGTTEGGTVVSKPAAHRPANATPGGCGAHPDRQAAARIAAENVAPGETGATVSLWSEPTRTRIVDTRGAVFQSTASGAGRN